MDNIQNDSRGTTAFPFRLAAIDLDGTLLGPDKTISPENIAAVDRLIACQGGLIRDGESGNVIEAHFLPQSVTRQIIGEAEKRDIQTIYYHLDHLYVGARNNKWVDLYEERVGERAEILPNLEQLDGRRALKIVWYGDPEILNQTRPEMSAHYGEKVDILSTERENLEFMPRGINKATALAKVAAELGVRPDQVLAFGDGENDVQMLAWAGMGIAMSHGSQAAINAAKRVSPKGPPETAFARAVDALFEERRSV